MLVNMCNQTLSSFNKYVHNKAYHVFTILLLSCLFVCHSSFINQYPPITEVSLNTVLVFTNCVTEQSNSTSVLIYSYINITKSYTVFN